jgi:hypothetical protein
MGAWTGTTMRFLSRANMSGTFTNVNFSSSTQILVFKQVTRAAVGDIIGYRIWNGSSNIFSQWLSRTSSPVGTAFNLPFSGQSLSNPSLVGSPSLVSIRTSGLTQATALINSEINDTTQVMTYSSPTAYLSGNTFVVGGNPGFDTNNDVEFAELIVYNKILNSTEYQKVEDYLKIKYQYNTWGTPTQTPTVTPTRTPTPTPPTPSPTRVNFYEYEVEYWERSGGSCNFFNTQTRKTISPLNTNQYYCISSGGAGRYRINLLNGFGPSSAPLFTPVGSGNVNCTVLLNC